MDVPDRADGTQVSLMDILEEEENTLEETMKQLQELVHFLSPPLLLEGRKKEKKKRKEKKEKKKRFQENKTKKKKRRNTQTLFFLHRKTASKR